MLDQGLGGFDIKQDKIIERIKSMLKSITETDRNTIYDMYSASLDELIKGPSNQTALKLIVIMKYVEKNSVKVEDSIVEILPRKDLVSLLNSLDRDLAAKLVNLTFKIRITDKITFNKLQLNLDLVGNFRPT